MHRSRTSVALVAYSSTSDVAGTYRTGVPGSAGPGFGCVARHLEEQELGWVRSICRRNGFVVKMRISSAASN